MGGYVDYDHSIIVIHTAESVWNTNSTCIVVNLSSLDTFSSTCTKEGNVCLYITLEFLLYWKPQQGLRLNNWPFDHYSHTSTNKPALAASCHLPITTPDASMYIELTHSCLQHETQKSLLGVTWLGSSCVQASFNLLLFQSQLFKHSSIGSYRATNKTQTSISKSPQGQLGSILSPRNKPEPVSTYLLQQSPLLLLSHEFAWSCSWNLH